MNSAEAHLSPTPTFENTQKLTQVWGGCAVEGSREQTLCCPPAATRRVWTLRVVNDAPLGLRTFARYYAKLQIRLFAPEMHSEKAPAATSAGVCFSFSKASGNQMRTHTRQHTRATHTLSPEAPPVRTLRASDPALGRGNPGSGAQRASRASPCPPLASFPRTWCHPSTPTLNRGAQLCTTRRCLLVQAPSAPRNGQTSSLLPPRHPL